ncbi:MAG: type II toxin-antitoxin system RelE/ParE family toxin [Candidatus Omnitrophota bacterium]
MERLKSKISEISKNPYHYKPLRYPLNNRRRTHLGSFVLIFEIDDEEKAIVFHSFRHHDDVYGDDD